MEKAVEGPEVGEDGGSKGGVLARVFPVRNRKKSKDLEVLDGQQPTVSEGRTNNQELVGGGKGSKVEHVHNPDFFELDGTVEATPRTQHLSMDDDDDVAEEDGDGGGAEGGEEDQATTEGGEVGGGSSSNNNNNNSTTATTSSNKTTSTSNNKRSPKLKSPRRQHGSSGDANGGGRRRSLSSVINSLANISNSNNNNGQDPNFITAKTEDGEEEDEEQEEILSASHLPPAPPSVSLPPPPPLLPEGENKGPASPSRSPPPPLIGFNGASTGKQSGVSFFGLVASSPRAFIDIPSASDSAGGAGSRYQHGPSFSHDQEITPPPSQSPPQGGVAAIREVGGGTSTILGGHVTAMLATGDPERRVSMRLMAPLMRRYSQEIKTGGFGIATTRIKEKKQIEAAVNRFNQKPLAGIDMLVTAGIIKRTPEDVVAFIRQKGSELSKKRIGELVGGLDPFCQEVLRLLLQEYDFTGMSLPQALRVLIMDIRFPGESQMIDRIIERFSQRYYECNEAAFATQDCVHILSFSLIMLNTDLHNRNLNPRKKMKLEDFIKNNRSINNGQDLPRELLEALYHEIKSHELRMKEGDMYESDILTFMAPRLSGWLWKKSEGTFVQWKRHWFVLTGGCVYYFTAPQHSTPRCIIPLDSVTAAKGSSSTEIILYSNFGTVIKSVKIVEGRMVQGDHRRYVLRAADSAERDEWVEALQRETVVPLVEVDRLKATNASNASGASTARSPHPHHQTSNVSSAAGVPKSPRTKSMVVQHESVYRCMAEGWMRRRSDVSRSWQRRYFMLIATEKKRDRRVVMLHYFTTQEMAQRMVDLGVSTEQGSIPMSEVTAFRVKTPADVINYRPPDAKATVFEIEYDRFRELVSPEDEASLQYWLDALRPVIHNANA